MSPNIPALDSENPYSSAEFVIYSTTEDMVNYEPQTELGQETGIVGIGLWARYPDDGIEIPLYSQSEQGVWLSMDADQSLNSRDEVVSEAFTHAIAYLTEKDVANGWGNVCEETWDELNDEERYLVSQFRHALIGGQPAPELVLAMEACKEQVGVGNDE